MYFISRRYIGLVLSYRLPKAINLVRWLAATNSLGHTGNARSDLAYSKDQAATSAGQSRGGGFMSAPGCFL